jgi:hypothetical protein
VLLEERVREFPEEATAHGALGLAYAGLGRRADALREGNRGVDLLPVSREAYRGPYRLDDLARIHMLLGDYDAAIGLLEELLAAPSHLSPPLLRLDPAWDALRQNPRFKRLIGG